MPTSLIARSRRAAIALAVANLVLAGLAPAVMAADGLTVTTPYPSIAVAPGSSASFDLTIDASTSGTASLAVTGAPDGWKATIHGGGFVVSGVTVTASKPGTARLDVTVPGDATGSASLSVRAQLNGATATLPIKVTVDAAVAGDITLTTTSPSLTGSSDSPFTFDLTLQNGSAEDQTISATATGPAGWTVDAKLSTANAASTVVKAGASTTITVTATPPQDAPAGHTDIDVSVTAGTRTIPGKLGIDITGTFTMRLTTPANLLSAHGSAGAGTTQELDIENTGTGALTGVSVTATQPTGWKVDFNPKTLDAIAPGAKGVITATITPAGEAVAGDYVVTFNATSTAAGDAPAARSTADIRFTVETSPIWALVGLGVIAVIVLALFYVFRTYGRR